MNYYEARKLKDGSGWHFTGMHNGQIWREGDCRNHEPHATCKEAEECFHSYLLAGQKEESYGDWTGCEICGEPTKKGLTTRPPHGNGYPLCDEHRTPETLASLVEPPSQIISSY